MGFSSMLVLVTANYKELNCYITPLPMTILLLISFSSFLGDIEFSEVKTLEQISDLRLTEGIIIDSNDGFCPKILFPYGVFAD